MNPFNLGYHIEPHLIGNTNCGQGTKYGQPFVVGAVEDSGVPQQERIGTGVYVSVVTARELCIGDALDADAGCQRPEFCPAWLCTRVSVRIFRPWSLEMCGPQAISSNHRIRTGEF